MEKITVILLLISFSSLSQDYSLVEAKEEYDMYNEYRVFTSSGGGYNPCIISPYNDGRIFGNGMSKILEGYIYMYNTTKDNAYLYKFLVQSLCVMENRHDVNFDIADFNPAEPSSFPHPRWAEDPSMYSDGYMLGTLSRFIYLIKNEEPSLFNLPIYQLEEIKPGNYQEKTCNCNRFNITFSTFGQYANWLQDRVGESLWWFLTDGDYWSDDWGMNNEGVFPNLHGVAINQQVGFGKALLFIGLTSGEQSFLNKALKIAQLYKSHLHFYDQCEDLTYHGPVLRYNASNNSYWWYVHGWKRYARRCNFLGGLKYYDYAHFTEYYEDISHGGNTIEVPLNFYEFQNNTPFTQGDMIRFRNTFTKNIYDGAGGFYNAVTGADAPVFNNSPCSEDNTCPHNFHKMVALSYMPFADYDGAGNTTTPNVYDILMDFYIEEIAEDPNIPSGYSGQTNKGHAYLVQAQWERECPNLTLFNRKVVYDQDFFAKANLTIAQKETNGIAYAHPQIWEEEFTIEPNVKVEMTAPISVELKEGTHIKANAEFHAYINEELCAGEGGGHGSESE